MTIYYINFGETMISHSLNLKNLFVHLLFIFVDANYYFKRKKVYFTQQLMLQQEIIYEEQR